MLVPTNFIKWSGQVGYHYWDGRQKIGDNQLGDLQRNSKIGATVAVPIIRRHSLKFGYSIGMVTEFGTDFNQFLVNYSVLLNKFKS
jgi:hypothetical protein